MQFYLDGFRPGDPEIHPAASPSSQTPAPGTLAEVAAPTDAIDPVETVDVLIVGTGPAGTVLAAQLAEFPDITTKVVERRGGPLELGHADGVACRTVEMFDAFGLAERLVREAYWVNETTFWGPDALDSTRIVRTGRIDDVEEGLSEYPHVIVNQARMQDFLLERMAKSPTRLSPDYGLEVQSVGIDDSSDHPVTVSVTQTHLADDTTTAVPTTIRAKYVVGCDGARSPVRRSLGIEMTGDARNHAWGVMDVFAVTDFPDIRLKSAIQSATGGSVLLIPREGGYMIRLYADLGDLDPSDKEARSRFTSDEIIAAAQRIFRPYTLEIRDIAWWSVYEVGQRIAERFDDLAEAEHGTRHPRVFIAGDACHTHSAKAGQGMNVSMQDAFNLGWKLASVLRGLSPESLLDTYAEERKAIAQELIDFDLRWSEAMAAKPADPNAPEAGGMSSKERQAIFAAGGRFTAGFATHYPPNMITGPDDHEHLATGFPIGERFHSAPVIRLADAKPLELGHEAAADGRWRLYAFADSANPQSPGSPIAKLCRFLADGPDSPVRRHTPTGADPDAIFDVRAVFQQGHRALGLDAMPSFLLPRKGRLGLIDYEKMFCADVAADSDIFTRRGIDRERGALVVVRPDQYVAHVLPLDAHTQLTEFFARVMNPQN